MQRITKIRVPTSSRIKTEHDVALKFAVDEYINTEEPSLTKIAKKY
jgi:hypothetical protein